MRAISALCLAFSALLALASSAQAEDPRYLVVDYDFNAGGISVGKARFGITFENGEYVATSNMKTAGLAEKFFRSRYDILATGQYLGKEQGVIHAGQGIVKPERYDSDFVGASGDRKLTLLWDKTGLALPVITDPPYGPGQIFDHAAPDEDKRASVDPMAAWVHAVVGSTITEEKPCGTTVPIFDGRRRYNLNFTAVQQRVTRVKRGKLNYKGPAWMCQVLYERISGFKPDELTPDDGLPIPPLEVWIAELGPENGPKYHIPMRMLAETPIGWVVMIARNISYKPIADPRVTAVNLDPDLK